MDKIAVIAAAVAVLMAAASVAGLLIARQESAKGPNSRAERATPSSDAVETEPEMDGNGRPLAWAQPVGKPGLPNLHKVSDTLWRGAQPDDEGFAELKKMGVKTVVNLRKFHSDRSECAEAGLKYVKIGMNAWHPEDEDVAEFLKVVSDPACQPVFVHCQHGADRTGMMSAFYRTQLQGWDRDEALREMTSGGFGFHGVWQNLVRYVEDIDLAKVRREAGLPDPPKPGAAPEAKPGAAPEAKPEKAETSAPKAGSAPAPATG